MHKAKKYFFNMHSQLVMTHLTSQKSRHQIYIYINVLSSQSISNSFNIIFYIVLILSDVDKSKYDLDVM